MTIQNASLARHPFLRAMYDSAYFPDGCVDKVKAVLVSLCESLDSEKPADLASLYEMTHAATERINELQDEFYDNDSEIETEAREVICLEFETIAKAYGFEADLEELTATRDW